MTTSRARLSRELQHLREFAGLNGRDLAARIRDSGETGAPTGVVRRGPSVPTRDLETTVATDLLVAQLDRVVSLAAMDNVHIDVLAINGQAVATPWSNFVVYECEEAFVMVELIHASLKISDPEDVEQHIGDRDLGLFHSLPNQHTTPSLPDTSRNWCLRGGGFATTAHHEHAAALTCDALTTASEVSSGRTISRIRALQQQIRPLHSVGLAELDEEITT